MPNLSDTKPLPKLTDQDIDDEVSSVGTRKSESNLLRRELKETQSKLKARDEYLQNTILTTAKRIADLDIQIAELTSNKLEAQSELDRVKEDNDFMQQELEQLQRDKKRLLTKLSEKTSAIEALNREVENSVKYAPKPDSASAEAQTDPVHQPRLVIDEPSNLFLLCNMKVSAAEAIVATQDDLIQDMTEQMETLEIDYSHQLSENIELQRQLGDSRAQLQQKNLVIDSLISRVDSLETLLSSVLLRKATDGIMAQQAQMPTQTKRPPSDIWSGSEYLPSPPSKSSY